MRLIPALSAALVLLLAACTSVTSTVEGYSVIPADLAPKTVHIAPGPGMSGDSLAWRSNAESLAGVLAARGYASVPRGEARLLARFSYAAGAAETERYPVRVPIQGIIGYETREVREGVLQTVPIRGTIGYRTEYETRTVYPRQISVTMRDARSGQPVFEASASSRDTCDRTDKVVALMLGAALKSFPEAQSGRVTQTGDKAC
ncbi:DUF4136 domain-containing protein [Oceanicola sp. S124]|uniref:DUF4136 domain-containing protein n=1 Tax=Oceanicola sp. S124 TaxID=1042378 RepID=UPI0002559687|nr:DUF4136 domain-containing protein [Oceanicola sp. S124]